MYGKLSPDFSTLEVKYFFCLFFNLSGDDQSLTVPKELQTSAGYEVCYPMVLRRAMRTEGGRNTTIRQETIDNCHGKFMTT